MIMFIASEVMFFVAWFWAYFDVSLFPAGVHDAARTRSQVVGMVERNALTGGVWPPKAGRRRSTARSIRGACRWSTR